MTTQRVHIFDLVDRTVTRSKGNLAYGNLKPRLDGDQLIEIDLSGDHPLSLSFLDEIARQLAEADRLGQVVFVVGEDEQVLRKLSRIAEIRQIDINCMDTGTMNVLKVPRLPAMSTELIRTGFQRQIDDP